MKCTHPFMSKLFAPKFLMRFKFLQGTQVDHSRLRRSGRAFPSPRPPSPMVDLWQVYLSVCLVKMFVVIRGGIIKLQERLLNEGSGQNMKIIQAFKIYGCKRSKIFGNIQVSKYGSISFFLWR